MQRRRLISLALPTPHTPHTHPPPNKDPGPDVWTLEAWPGPAEPNVRGKEVWHSMRARNASLSLPPSPLSLKYHCSQFGMKAIIPN